MRALGTYFYGSGDTVGSALPTRSSCSSGGSFKSLVGTLAFIAAAFGAFAPSSAVAAPEEIVIFDDEFEKPGEFGYELHFNYARGRRTPDYPGEQPPHGILRVMPEVAYGLSEKWNLGVHMPMSHSTVTGMNSIDGFKVRLTYLNTTTVPNGNYFYGFNTELNYLEPRLSEHRYVLELRGILGMRRGDWLFAVNPIFNRPLNYVPGVDNHFNFDLFAKAMKKVRENVSVGVEHYLEMGEVETLRIGSTSGQITYGIVEFETKSHYNIHLGVGRGWTDPTDHWVYKAMIGLPF